MSYVCVVMRVLFNDDLNTNRLRLRRARRMDSRCCRCSFPRKRLVISKKRPGAVLLGEAMCNWKRRCDGNASGRIKAAVEVE